MNHFHFIMELFRALPSLLECFSDITQDIMGKVFPRLITEDQFPLACCIFYVVETMSGTAEAMGSAPLFKRR